jgi:hypothetical protein
MIAPSAPEKQRPILIGLCYVTERSAAAIETLLRSTSQCSGRIVVEPEAEIVIVDLDSGNPAEMWLKFRQRFPTHPAIALSIAEQQIPDVIWVKKPIKPVLLLEAITLASKQLKPAPVPAHPPKQPTSAASVTQASNEVLISQLQKSKHSDTTSHVTKSHKISAQAPTIDQPVIDQPVPPSEIVVTARSESKNTKHTRDVTLAMEGESSQGIFGNHPDIDPQNPDIPAHIFYDPHVMLQGLITETMKAARANGKSRVIKSVLATILVIPDAPGWILTSLSTQRIRAISAVHLANMLQTNVRDLIERKRPILLPRHPLENFLWLVALSAARGRVPLGTDLRAPVKLERWPNFTRLEVIPHAMRISALWLTQPMNLLETATRLHIPQRYVFAFYSAAHAVGIASTVIVPASTSKSGITTQLQSKPKESNSDVQHASKEQRSFLGKLLNRLMRD